MAKAGVASAIMNARREPAPNNWIALSARIFPPSANRSEMARCCPYPSEGTVHQVGDGFKRIGGPGQDGSGTGTMPVIEVEWWERWPGGAWLGELREVEEGAGVFCGGGQARSS